MVLFQHGTFTSSPLGDLALPHSRQPVVTEFRAGAEVGFLARIAVRGKYRRQNNARAHAMGYHTMGKWPLVPLQGDIVRKNPTSPLEMYQANYAYAALAGAKQQIYMVRLTRGGAGLVARQLRVHLGDESSAEFLYPTTEKSWGREAEYGFAVRVGDNVLTLNVSGGWKMRETMAVRLARKAVHDMSRACAKRT
ncbi:MAG: hypothetical protein ACRDFX_11840 [Chloroflexota bacterium]